MTGKYSKSASDLAAAIARTEEVIVTGLCLVWRRINVQIVFTSRCRVVAIFLAGAVRAGRVGHLRHVVKLDLIPWLGLGLRAGRA
jgi:hypothetical protein